MLLVGPNLTGLVTGNSTTPSDQLRITEDVNHKFFLNNKNEWLSTIKFCGNSGAFRFGSEYTPCIYLVVKNSVNSTSTYNGYVIYQNTSNMWTNATGGREYINESSVRTTDLYTQWRLVSSGQANQYNLQVTLPPYYYLDESTRFEAIFALNKLTTTPWKNSWKYKLLTIKVPETTNFGRTTNSGKWVLYYSFPTVASTDGTFTESPTASSSSYVTYEHGWPFCSPRGSCINAVFGGSGGTLNYAINAPQ